MYENCKNIYLSDVSNEHILVQKVKHIPGLVKMRSFGAK